MKILTSFLLVLSACSIIASKSFAQQWEFQRESDPISDSQNVIAALPATSDAGAVIIRCLQQTLDAMIVWAFSEAFDYETNNTGIPVITRLDQQDPVESIWWPSSDLTTTFTVRAEAFIRELASHDRLVARSTTITGITTLIFDLAQAGSAVEEILEVCGHE